MTESTHQKKMPVRYGLGETLYLTCLVICSGIISAANNQPVLNSPQLPPLETFVIEPIKLENISIWVPSARGGPMINRGCQPKENLYFFALPASVRHEKTGTCPDEIARLLAESTASYYKQTLPLTIVDGWRWEYSCNLAQFESTTYNLRPLDGWWESSWEAILTQSTGLVNCQWLYISEPTKSIENPVGNEQKSSIEVNNFSYLRIRRGYPKKQNF